MGSYLSLSVTSFQSVLSILNVSSSNSSDLVGASLDSTFFAFSQNFSFKTSRRIFHSSSETFPRANSAFSFVSTSIDSLRGHVIGGTM
jgi:hypothetical protein